MTLFDPFFDPFLALLRNPAQNGLLSSFELMILKWASKRTPQNGPILGVLAGVPFICVVKQLENLLFAKDCLLDISLPRAPDPAGATFGPFWGTSFDTLFEGFWPVQAPSLGEM